MPSGQKSNFCKKKKVTLGPICATLIAFLFCCLFSTQFQFLKSLEASRLSYKSAHLFALFQKSIFIFFAQIYQCHTIYYQVGDNHVAHPRFPSSQLRIGFSSIAYPNPHSCFMCLPRPTIYNSYEHCDSMPASWLSKGKKPRDRRTQQCPVLVETLSDFVESLCYVQCPHKRYTIV